MANGKNKGKSRRKGCNVTALLLPLTIDYLQSAQRSTLPSVSCGHFGLHSKAGFRGKLDLSAGFS